MNNKNNELLKSLAVENKELKPTKELIIYFNNAKINIYTFRNIEIAKIFYPHSIISECEIFIKGKLDAIRCCGKGIICIDYRYAGGSAFSISIETVENYKVRNIAIINSENSISMKLAHYYKIKDIEVIPVKTPTNWLEVLELEGYDRLEEDMLHITFEEFDNPFHIVHGVTTTKSVDWFASVKDEIIKIDVPYNEREEAYK